jgi:hypothetical protein
LRIAALASGERASETASVSAQDSRKGTQVATEIDVDLDFRSILERSFAILISNIAPIILLAFLIVGLPSYLLTGGMLDRGVLGRGFFMGFGLTDLILMAAQAMLVAALTRVVIRTLRKEPIDLGIVLKEAWGLILGVLAVALVTGFLIGVGYVCFVLPGVVLSVLWFVAIPVAVIERAGVGAAMSRSIALTKHSRWEIFAFVLLLFVLKWVFGFISGLVFGVVGLDNLVDGVVDALFAAFLAIATIVIYFDLRAGKEGQSGLMSAA